MNVMGQKANNNQRVYGCVFKICEDDAVHSMLTLFDNAEAMLDFVGYLEERNADIIWCGRTEMNRSADEIIASLEKSLKAASGSDNA